MARKVSKAKLKAIAAEYLTNGLNPVNALVHVGYSRKYAQSYHKHVFDNQQLQDIIAKMQAKIELKADITRRDVVKGLIGIIEGEKTSNRDKISSYALISDISGFKRESAPNKERIIHLKKIRDVEQQGLTDEFRKAATSRTEIIALAQSDEPYVIDDQHVAPPEPTQVPESTIAQAIDQISHQAKDGTEDGTEPCTGTGLNGQKNA